MKKHLAVFDWNGTLLDDAKANFEGANSALKKAGASSISFEHYQETFDFPIIHFYHRNGIDTDTYLGNISEINKAFLSVYEKLALNCGARDGANDLLKWLQSHDVTCMVLSNHVYDSIHTNLERVALLPYIGHISSNPHDNDIMFKMNKQERLERYLEESGFDPAHAFIIGDSLEEPEIGKNLGLMTVSITGGCISENRLKKAKPDHLIHDLGSLKAILSREWGLSLD